MADQKSSRFLTEEEKNEIIRLAKLGFPQLKIMKMLGASQYAVTRYAKGINPPKKIGEEQKAEVILLLQETDYTTKKIAELVGVSPRCVTRINRMAQIRQPRRGASQFTKDRQIPQRDHSLRYEVFVYNWVGHCDAECAIMFDHVPCYWDLRKACEQMGVEADDFETEPNSSVRDKICFGTVYDKQGVGVANYTIERIVGDASDYDMFWDGMDRDFYDS